MNESLELIINMLPFLIPLFILQTILTITALISAVRKKTNSTVKIVWILIILFVNLLGSVLYYAIGSKMLDNIVQNEAENGGGNERY